MGDFGIIQKLSIIPLKFLMRNLGLKESTLGTNKKKIFSEYHNTLKIEAFQSNIFVFDKYHHQIIKLKQIAKQ